MGEYKDVKITNWYPRAEGEDPRKEKLGGMPLSLRIWYRSSWSSLVCLGHSGSPESKHLGHSWWWGVQESGCCTEKLRVYSVHVDRAQETSLRLQVSHGWCRYTVHCVYVET